MPFPSDAIERDLLYFSPCVVRLVSLFPFDDQVLPSENRLLVKPLPLIVLLLFLASCAREEIAGPGPEGPPPLPPAGLLIREAHDGFAVLDWLKNEEPTIARYVVYRGVGENPGAFLPIDSTESTLMVDLSLSEDTLYTWFVVAVDRYGRQSEPGNRVSARIPNDEDPPEPRAFTVHALDQVRPVMLLSWEPPGIADLLGFRIYRSETEDPLADPLAWSTETSATSWKDEALELVRGRRYTYAVVTVDRGGRRSALAAKDGDLLTESPVLLTPGEGERVKSWLTFVWMGGKESGYDPEIRFWRLTVLDSPSGGERWSRLLPATPSSPIEVMYQGPLLESGRTYFWKVASVTKSDGTPNAWSVLRSFQVVD